MNLTTVTLAPWWHTSSDNTAQNRLSPTVSLAGFILKNATKDTDLYRVGLRIVKETSESYIKGGTIEEVHTGITKS